MLAFALERFLHLKCITTATLLLGNLLAVLCATSVSVELVAPRWVPRGGSATLRCVHDVAEHLLYKVEFLRSGSKLLQYVRERKPPFTDYAAPGCKINMSLTTENSITLQHMDFAASGVHWCEVSLETPIYTAASRGQEVTVVYAQKHPPLITFGGSVLAPGSAVRANCSSAPAHPPPHITWLLNGMKVDETMSRDFTFRVSMSRSGRKHRYHRHQFASDTGLRTRHSPSAHAHTSSTHNTTAHGCSTRDSFNKSFETGRRGNLSMRPSPTGGGAGGGGVPVSQLTVAISELNVEASGKLELTCISTVPGYVAPNDYYADTKNQTVTVTIIDKPEKAVSSSSGADANTTAASDAYKNISLLQAVLVVTITAMFMSEHAIYYYLLSFLFIQ